MTATNSEIALLGAPPEASEQLTTFIRLTIVRALAEAACTAIPTVLWDHDPLPLTVESGGPSPWPLRFDKDYRVLGSDTGAVLPGIVVVLDIGPSLLAAVRTSAERAVNRALFAAVPLHLGWRIMWGLPTTDAAVTVRAGPARLGLCRLGETVQFGEEPPVSNSAAPDRGPASGGPDTLLEAIVQAAEVCRRARPDADLTSDPKLRQQLGNLLSCVFRDGQLLTAQDLNALVSRIDELERRLDALKPESRKRDESDWTT